MSTFLRQAINVACQDSPKSLLTNLPAAAWLPFRITYLKCNCEHITFLLLESFNYSHSLLNKVQHLLSIVLLPGSSLPASWLSLSNWAQRAKAWILCSSPAFTVSCWFAEWNFLLVSRLLNPSLSEQLYCGSPSRRLLCTGFWIRHLFCASKGPGLGRGWGEAIFLYGIVSSWRAGPGICLYPQLSNWAPIVWLTPSSIP